MPKFLTPSTNLPTFRLVTVPTFLREKPSKISSQSPRSNQKSSDRFYCYCLINLWYDVQKTFSCLPTTENLNLCQKIFFGFASEEKPTSLLSFGTTSETNFSMQHSTPDQHPCSSLASHNWSGALLDLPVMPPLFFLNYFQIFPVDVILVEGRMLCHCRFVKALVLRMSLMLSQPCLERTKCLTDILVVTVLARNFVDDPSLFFNWNRILNSMRQTPSPLFRAVDYPNIQRS